jgi:biotin transport system ATP-binding protein
MLAENKKNGMTQVIAAHDLEPLADLAGSVMVLHQGKAVLNASIDEIAPRCAEYGVKPPGAAWPEAP